MLNLSETVREYRANAARARALADSATDSELKKYYLDIERYWLDRAVAYASAQQRQAVAEKSR